MEALRQKAQLYGATDFGLSNRKNKRFYVIYNNKYIHFGLKNGSTYIDHGDPIKRINYHKRHSKIIDKYGVPFYMQKSSPAFWSYFVLW